MPENWKTIKLAEVASIKGGKRMPKGHELVKELTNHPYIRVTDMGQRKISLNELLYAPDTSFEKISRYIVSANDIIVSIVGTIGSVAIIDDELNNASLTENCVKLTDLKEVYFSYLYYFLISNIGQYEISKGIVGSTQPKLPLYSIQNIDLLLPTLPEQISIASILSAIDDRIELNIQMNETLQEMAMTLYKHWFVDFGPFKYGEFVDSELGRIPKGWEVKKMSQYWDNSQYGYTESSSKARIGPKFLRITDIQGGSVNWDIVPYCIIDEKDFNKYLIVKGDIFVARTGNSTGENTYILNAPDAVFASYLIRFQFDQLYKSCYIAKAFRSNRFFDFISGAKVGSAQPGISASTLGEFLLIIPPENLLIEFFNIVMSYDDMKEANFIENQTLTSLRDTLLPKLISGEVRVKDLAQT